MRFRTKFFIFLLLLVSSVYVSGGMIIDFASRRAIPIVKQRSSAYGVKIEDLGFKNANLSWHPSIKWNEVVTKFITTGSGGFKLPPGVSFKVNIESFYAIINDPSFSSVKLRVSNFVITPYERSIQDALASRIASSKAQGITSATLMGERYETTIPINFRKPQESIKSLANEFTALVSQEQLNQNATFEGKIRFRMNNRDMLANISTKGEGAERRLVVDREDIVNIAKATGDRLTKDEITILANNPFRTPLLLSIKNYASTTASQAHNEDERVPEDAYRHLLWSYLLTKQFGEEFAKKVTDAHEVGFTGNTAQERKQDYKNNAIGRMYARKGVKETDIRGLAISDPNVIRKYGRGWNE